jgi:ABC-type Fe3+/spermidine/putrescine transport system ATPase subunit
VPAHKKRAVNCVLDITTLPYAKVFLFDEPLSNLDASLRVQTCIEIANLNDSLTVDADKTHLFDDNEISLPYL